MEAQMYHLCIDCEKSPGVLVQLTHALEALDFDILNANLTSVNDHVLNTLVIQVKSVNFYSKNHSIHGSLNPKPETLNLNP